MGITTAKGEVGEAIILADLQRQGHGAAIPFGHDLPYDLIVVRKEDGALERVQCKYTTSNGQLKRIRFASRYRELTGDPHDRRTSGSAPPLPLTLDTWPE
jgi:hypothetical protein